MNQKNRILSLIDKSQVISIIGMAKNVGKTTTLNYIITKLANKKIIGLTSIGRDGELKDITLDTPKPRIYVNKGTIIATTSLCLRLSDFTTQILETTGINTSLGEVVIVRALSDGYVELAGPSINSQLKTVVTILQKHGAELVLIDGAINRKAIANIEISDSVILCTGASYSSNIDKVVNDTLQIVNLFLLPEVDKSLKTYFANIFNKTKIALIYKDNNIKFIKIPTIVNHAKIIIDELNDKVHYLLINGAITREFINELYNKRNIIKDLTIVIKHAVNCSFINSDYKFNNIKNHIKVLQKNNLLFLSINPTSPYGYKFSDKEFYKKLSNKLKLPIINVMSDKNGSIY